MESATFNFVNNCGGPVWPGILANAGTAKLETTGFQLPPGGSRLIQAPTGWSGRFWGRTGCSFDSSGHGSCSTGDCGSNQVECNGAGAAPPATLAEFTLASAASTKDFYDVSLVDGYCNYLTIYTILVDFKKFSACNFGCGDGSKAKFGTKIPFIYFPS